MPSCNIFFNELVTPFTELFSYKFARSYSVVFTICINFIILN